jgi:hypothetical protein
MTKTHAYEVATLVNYQPPGQSPQTFTIVGRLPAERSGPQYRLRSAAGQERVADEALLSPDGANPAP